MDALTEDRMGSRTLIHRLVMTAALVVPIGCSTSASNPPSSPVPPLVRTAESRPEVAAFLAETMVAEVCDQVRGRFLPIAQVPPGTPARGDEPVGGRWWVRDCRARTYEGDAAIYLEGVGWAWAGAEKDYVVASWSTSEYVFFGAAGTVVGAVDLAFDPQRRLASVQFKPRQVPYLNTTVTNRLEAHGSFGGKVISVISLGFAADHADDKANEIARSTLAEAFARQLGAGFAVTVDVPRRQRDTISLNSSAPPLRPYADGPRWLVNERQILHPKRGAFHVVGPFAPTPAANIDFNVVSGTVRYRAECENFVTAWFEPVVRGVAPILPVAAHGQAGVLGVGPTTRTLGTMCPWYLITEPTFGDATVDVRVRADRSGYPVPGL